MASPVFRPAGLLVRLRRRFRTSEAALIFLALGLGLSAGALTLLQSELAHFIQSVIYGLSGNERLSAQEEVPTVRLLALPFGGVALASLSYMLKRRGGRAPIDVVEANALHGGAIPMKDSLTVAAQTIISNGVGASVGLEAAYAQMGGGVASVVGQWLRLRRGDLRVLVGAGAGAAVGAAFGAPLTGAFYAFEIVIGAYTPAAIAPVTVASLAAAVMIRASGVPAYLIVLPAAQGISTWDYFVFAALGLVCAVVGTAVMRAVTLVEILTRRLPLSDGYRPVLGGLLLIPIASMSPQALSAGHGALHLDLTARVTLSFLATTFVLKVAASALSLGFGFRGGLFFASLFLGSLVGQLFAGVINLVPGAAHVSANDAALVGMAAMAVAVVGGPMTMSLLVLESTHDFALTAAALTASLCASTLVRETFGFSFSTWRLHTRGETIRSARDIGWVRSLTAGRMMRRGVPTIDSSMSVAEFRRRFPLGSIGKVVTVDCDGRYTGILRIPSVFAQDIDEHAQVRSLIMLADAALSPEDDAAGVMRAFEREEVDDLAVTDSDGTFLGILSERHVRRRYTEEIEKSQRELFGE